jgi:hypothetical protein
VVSPFRTGIRGIVDHDPLREIVRRLVAAVDQGSHRTLWEPGAGYARPPAATSTFQSLRHGRTLLPLHGSRLPGAVSTGHRNERHYLRAPAKVEDWAAVPTYVTMRDVHEGKGPV